MTPTDTMVLCLLAPFAGALVSLAAFKRPRVAAGCAIAFTLASFAGALLLVFQTSGGQVHALHVGSWSAALGITLVADGFSSLMLAVCQLVVLAALIFAAFTLPARYQRRHLFPLVLTLSLGTNGAFLTGDLFNLYVWFEVLLLSSFALMALAPGAQAARGTWRYVVINLLSSLLFLGAAGLIYGKTGTLNFAELHLRLTDAGSSALIESSAALLFGAFGIKAALVPLAFWLPGSYPHLPPALGALFAGLLTKVGLYALFRVFGFVLAANGDFPHRDVLLVLALLTMAAGVLGAVGQDRMREILSFHIISQVGYMALALALFSPLAIAAGIYYLVHHIVVKANLFLVAGLVELRSGSSDLARTSGLMRSAPRLALLFAVPALSLAGIPPLSGFFAKFSLLRSALADAHWISASIIVLVGLLTVFSMLKIWRAIFWGSPSGSGEAPTLRQAPLYAASAGLALVTILLGLAAGPVFALAREAAGSLLEPAAYLEAVLGTQVPPSP